MVVWGLARDRERRGREGFQRGKRELFGAIGSSYLDSGPSFTDVWGGGAVVKLIKLYTSNTYCLLCLLYINRELRSGGEGRIRKHSFPIIGLNCVKAKIL